MNRAGTGPHVWRITANYFTSLGLINRARGLVPAGFHLPWKAVDCWKPRLSQKPLHTKPKRVLLSFLWVDWHTARIYDFIFQTEEILASQHLWIFSSKKAGDSWCIGVSHGHNSEQVIMTSGSWAFLLRAAQDPCAGWTACGLRVSPGEAHPALNVPSRLSGSITTLSCLGNRGDWD